MSQRLSQYKTGSYGGGKSKNYGKANYAQRSAANQQNILAKRNLAPLARRGFNPMAVANNKERKYYDTPGQTFAVNTTGTFILAHIPVLGSDYNNRIGRKTLIKSLYIRGEIMINPAGSVEGFPAIPRTVKAQVARMIILLDTQPNGVAATTLNLLKEAEPLSHLNADNRDRFRILKDKLFTFDPWVYNPIAGAPAAASQYCCFGKTNYAIKIYKKLNIETVFNNSVDQTIAAINTNALYVYFIGNHVQNDDLEVKAKVSFRVRFDDI